MGKKQRGQGKAKKLARKAMISEEKAKMQIVKNANTAEDGSPKNVLEVATPFLKYTLKDESDVITFKFQHPSTMSKEEKDFVFDLTKENMQALYEACDWGWSDSKKKTELLEDDARYMIGYNKENEPACFVHFRFILEDDDRLYLYIYEIQVPNKYQKHGLGMHMMRTLEVVGLMFKMQYVALTVFKHNKAAMKFYREKLGYTISDESPSMCDEPSECYEILWKPVSAEAKKAVAAKAAEEKKSDA